MQAAGFQKSAYVINTTQSDFVNTQITSSSPYYTKRVIDVILHQYNMKAKT